MYGTITFMRRTQLDDSCLVNDSGIGGKPVKYVFRRLEWTFYK